jgi:WD40 repeat protein
MREVKLAVAILVALNAHSLGQGPPAASQSRAELVMPSRVVDLKMNDSRIACLLSDGGVIILDRDGYKAIATIEGNGLPPLAVAISSDGEWVATGSVREMITTANAISGPYSPGPGLGKASEAFPSSIKSPDVMNRFFHYDPIRTPPSMDRTIKVAYGGSIAVRRVSGGGEILRRTDFSDSIKALSFDGLRLTVVDRGLDIVAFDEGLRAVDLHKIDAQLSGVRYPHQNVLFGKRNTRVACLNDERDGRVSLFYCDCKSGGRAILSRDDAKHHPLWAIAMSSDGNKLAACGPGGNVTIWELGGILGTGRRIGSNESGTADLHYIEFGQDSDELVTAGNDGLFKILDIRNGRVAALMKGAPRDIRAVSLRGDRLTIVSGAYHYREKTIEPLIIEEFAVQRASPKP